MGQLSFWDESRRLDKLSELGDCLVRLQKAINTYISSTVVGIKDSAQYHTIKIKASDLLELDMLFSDVVHYTKVKDIAGQQQEIYSVTITKQKNHDIHSALIKIGRSIRSCWGRQIYKQLNGVEMSLDS